MRFNLTTMFKAVTIVAVLCAAVGAIRGCYYVQLDSMYAVLEEYPEIDRIWLCTNDDVTLEVEQVYFSTHGEPGAVYTVNGIDGASMATLRSRIDAALRKREQVELPPYAEEYPR